ncbi:hypothetical protein AB833_22500 [Chromatiales bacterium (ex Bugula neritina AB1)]|nr:hypothetical protein AB833_22500 [Chromatiales bacterium (ex Bugula neritina AB1)]
MSDAGVFLTEFIKNPRQLGSIIPSSGFLKRRILRAASLETAGTVVELGPGNGGTTRAILNAMPQTARLLSIELNPGLFELGQQIDDPRYTAHHGDASDLESILTRYNLAPPDVVISGIPFSCMDPAVATSILQMIHRLLNADGRFVAYQVSARVDELNTFYASERRKQEFELLNVPPLRVWRWQK